jgi:hypothetical protein
VNKTGKQRVLKLAPRSLKEVNKVLKRVEGVMGGRVEEEGLLVFTHNTH